MIFGFLILTALPL